MAARYNLTQLCERYLEGRHRIDIVDVFESAAVALKHHVLVTPTLIVLKPKLGVTLLGNLSETSQVMASLRLNGKDDEQDAAAPTAEDHDAGGRSRRPRAQDPPGGRDCR